MDIDTKDFVTDDNSGGYFVCECQNCGHVFSSEHAHGGEPNSDAGDHDDIRCPKCEWVDPDECENPERVWNAQQAKINQLNKELETQRTENARLIAEKGFIERQLSAVYDQLKVIQAEREAMMKQEPLGFVQSYVVDTGLNGFTATLNPVREGKYTVPVFPLHPLPPQQIPEGYAKIPAKKPLPDLMLASFHNAQGWNSCVDFMLSASQPKEYEEESSRVVVDNPDYEDF